MIVKTYRLKKYQDNLSHNGLFYDSKYLQLSFLNAQDDDLNAGDIHNAQLEAAHNFLKTKIQTYTTMRLNADLMLQSFIESYNAEENIVQRIWERIENLYETGHDIQNTSNKQLKKQQAEKCNQLITQYSEILKIIEKSAQDQNNIIHSNILLTRLKDFEMEFNRFEQSLLQDPMQTFTKLTGQQGYLNMLYVYDRLLKGYVLEEDVVNKAKNFAFSDLKLDDNGLTAIGVGTLYVGGKMSPIDVFVYNKQQLDILNMVKISYKKALPGDSDHKIEIKGVTMKNFLETMENERGEWNFYIDESAFLLLCKNSLMAIQAKAFRPKASIKFKSDVKWKEFSQYFNGIETQILSSMYELYHLSAQLPKGKHKKNEPAVYDNKSWYAQSMPQYAYFAQKALARNFPYIVGEQTSFILTNEKGLETTGDFILRKIEEYWHFKWQNNYSYKTLNISKLSDLKYDIRLTLK